ncbi:glycoside hydrolase family 2 protein [Pleomassaria siparia CBS 279.74]|uniref:Beta-mannosidase B n=1 Tax=Pleomassaria siparia CBS 279.74 TaxID=1314801 RepID=A0A6G1KM75_9PLEO|nr:glycoside hydrolase family 2 protein [Pleomassaria siparia CBS 279.74]
MGGSSMASIPFTSQALTSGWTFTQGDGSVDITAQSLNANDLPTEIHLDLLKNGKIADPFNDLNELSVRWVGDETWTYRKTFPTPSEKGKPGVRIVLACGGLDTFASVYLNGTLILESENMFLAHRIDITTKLLGESKTPIDRDEENVLQIVFQSARKRGLELLKDHPEHRFIVHQTELSRGPVRKAQYHWGWDWGPILMTAGPWKKVVLETYVTRIEDVWVEYELSNDLKKAKGKIFAKIEGEESKVRFKMRKSSEGHAAVDLDGKVENGVSVATFDLDVDLWWPRGYGSQSLYVISATLISDDGAVLDSTTKTVGFRKVALVQEKDTIGTSFYFRINDIDIFAGGSCWIPADSFLSRVTPERYFDWMKLAADGNQIMIRVWGGGIYEHDAFYEAADELGLLVWQDFMFACANYPAYSSYLKSVEEEARQNVRRIRNHPSVVLWCGNNEDYQIVERYSLEYRYEEDKNPESWLKTNFPARYIYEYLLPKIVLEEAVGVPYHPSSPFGDGISTTLKVDPKVGDVHQWNVWHGEMKPYQQLPEMGGRFVSEFGMEAYPHLETLGKSIAREEDRYPGSMAMDFRNKAIGHERRLVSYVAENFKIKYDLAGYTHLSQVMQADAMSWAYKSWRRQWGTSGNRECGGVLVWQLNDCWPTMSWAIIDYYLVPKPSYYAIKRAMKPIVVGVTRKFKNWTMRPADELWNRDTSHIDMKEVWEDIEFDVWVGSSSMSKSEGNVAVRFVSVRSGEDVYPSLSVPVHIEANGTTEVIKGQKVGLPGARDENTPLDMSKIDPFVIQSSLSIDGEVVARDVSWPDPIKYLNFPDRGVEVNLSSTSAIVSAKRPVKGFVFQERQGVSLDDNGFDLMPGEKKTVVVAGQSAHDLKWDFVGM